MFPALWIKLGRIIDTQGENSGLPASWYACQVKMAKTLTILSFCFPTRSQALHVEALLSRRVSEPYNTARGEM